jgi:DNA primase
MATDQVEQVKQKVDIVEIIGEKVTLKKAGRHFKGLCPFHSEKSPSFIVSPERQSFKCFGCQEGGDVFSFLQKYDGMTFLEALETLAKRVGITLESYRPTSQDSQKKHLITAMDLASEYYHFLLTQHESGKTGLEYLHTRGITNESIAQYKLGWSPNSWRSVSDYLVRKKGYTDAELELTGMVIRSDRGGYYDRFRGRVMFPLRDHRGVVVGFSGRTLSQDVKEAKYINSPETILYSKSKMLYGMYENREAIRKEDKIVLVEGELDVIPSVQAGVKPVVAIKGSAFTEEQARLINRYTKNIYMALDADAAGQEAIKRAVNIADSLDMSIRVVQITGGKDPGEVATKDAKTWREMVKGAVLYWDFLIDTTLSNYPAGSAEAVKSVSTYVIPAIASISNLVIRAHYVTELAKRLAVPEDSVYDEIERLKKKKELLGLRETVKKIETGEAASRRQTVEEYLLAIALQYFPKIREKLTAVDEKWFVSRAAGLVLSALQKWPEKELNIQVFSRSIPSELQHVIDRTYLSDLSNLTDIEREWDKVAMEVKELYLKARLTELTTQIAQMEAKTPDNEKVQSLQAEFSDISRQLAQITK